MRYFFFNIIKGKIAFSEEVKGIFSNFIKYEKTFGGDVYYSMDAGKLTSIISEATDLHTATQSANEFFAGYNAAN